MSLSPHSFKVTSDKIQQFKSKATFLLQQSNVPIDIHLNRLIAESNSSLHIQAATHLYQQCKNRTQSLETIYQMLMKSIQMIVAWMGNYQQLESSLLNYEQYKNNQEKRLKYSLDEYSITIDKLMDQKQQLQNEVNGIWDTKQHFKKLYEDEIRTSCELLFINSNISCKKSKENQQKNKFALWEQTTSQYEDNRELNDIIEQLRSQNGILKSEIKQLRYAEAEIKQLRYTEAEWNSQKVNQTEEFTLEEDCIVTFPTQSSVLKEDKHTLASEILQLQKKVSEARVTNCFNYLSQQKIKQNNSDELNSKQQQKVIGEILAPSVRLSLVKHKNIRENKQIQENQSSLIFFIKKVLKRFVTDRIKRH